MLGGALGCGALVVDKVAKGQFITQPGSVQRVI